MKRITLLFGVLLAMTLASCDNKTENTSANASKASNVTSTQETSTAKPTQETIDELKKAVTEDHANPDASYSYDAATNTVTMVKEIDFTTGKGEDDYDELTEFNKFVEEFKKSTKPSDATIKSKGATITVTYVNKATGEEFMNFDITPEDLK